MKKTKIGKANEVTFGSRMFCKNRTTSLELRMFEKGGDTYVGERR